MKFNTNKIFIPSSIRLRKFSKVTRILSLILVNKKEIECFFIGLFEQQ